MSNVNKHLLAASQEEFEEGAENAAVVAADPQETWVDLPETSMADVHEGEEAKGALDQLADRVDGAAEGDVAALEAFNWTYRTLTQLTGLAPKVYPSLEDFNGDAPMQKKVLAKSIRKHSERLGRAITLSIEDYTESFGATLKNLIENMQASAKDLDRSLARVSGVPGKKVKVDHSRIWAMLHVDGKFMKDLNTGLTGEEQDLKELIQLASTAAKHVGKENGLDEVNAAINRGGKYKLMFNTTVTFSNGKAEFDRVQPPSPKTEKVAEDYLRGAAWGALIGFFVFFMWVPGAVIGALGSSATGKTSTSKRDLDQAKNALRAMGEFAEFAKDIEKVADELDAAVKGAAEGKEADVKRAAAPVMELLGAITRHIAELCFGGKTLASALASAE